MGDFQIRKELQAADPSSGVDVNSSGSVPNFAQIARHAQRKRFLGAGAVVGVLAIPVAIAAFAFGGGSPSTVELADLKGAKSKPAPTAVAAPVIQNVEFSGAPSLELGATASELVGADQNFRSGRDGFSFPNYGGEPTSDVIDATTMAALFGKESVCADAKAATCVILPGAQAVADQLNAAMAAGRCEGFSVLSQRFFDNLDTRPDGLGATNQVAHSSVAKQLGYWWATQVAPSVAASSKSFRSMTPSAIALELAKGLKSKAGYTMGLYSPAGGHSVTPIAVTKNGATQYIYVYDNNYPNEIRKIAIDTAT